MTVTDTPARVGRNTETDAKASTVDVGLSSIILLKGQGKSSVKDIAAPTRFRRRLENSPSEDKRWIRSAGQGDWYAMPKLVRRLLGGDRLRKLRAEVQVALRNSPELGNPFVMQGLAANDIIRSF